MQWTSFLLTSHGRTFETCLAVKTKTRHSFANISSFCLLLRGKHSFLNLYVWSGVCLCLCEYVLRPRGSFWNKFSGDKPLIGVGVWPLDSLIYLAMLDGSDEMTTKIKPRVRTWGIPNRFLTRSTWLERSSGHARSRGISGCCMFFFFSHLACSYVLILLLQIISRPEISPRVISFNAILHLTSAKPM